MSPIFKVEVGANVLRSIIPEIPGIAVEKHLNPGRTFSESKGDQYAAIKLFSREGEEWFG